MPKPFPAPYTISNNWVYHAGTHPRTSVKMMATSTATEPEVADMDGYWEENVPVVPRGIQNEDTKNYWDKMMENREPIKLPYWVEEDGAQVIKNDEKRKIGWIGLGQTGYQLAFLLVRAGYDVTVFDKDKSKADELVKFGAKFA